MNTKQKATIKLGFDVTPDFKEQFTKQAKAKGLSNKDFLITLVNQDNNNLSSYSNPHITKWKTACSVNIDYIINDIRCNNTESAITKLKELKEDIWNH